MNPIDYSLTTVHYYSPISSAAFVLVMLMGGFMRKWTRAGLEIYFIVYCFYLLDIAATFIAYNLPNDVSNRWFYNVIQVPQLGVMLFYFTSKLQSENRRKVYTIAYYLFICVHLIMTTIVNGWLQLNVYALVPMTAIVGLAAFECLRETIDDISINPFTLPFFWFAFATAVSYFGSVPVTSLYFRLEQSAPDLANRIWNINDIVYGLWFIITAFGLIWINRKTTPSYS